MGDSKAAAGCVERLLAKAQDMSELNRQDRQLEFDRALAEATVLELQALRLIGSLVFRRFDRPSEDVERQSLHLLVRLVDHGYEFATGSQRIVIIAANHVYKLAFNSDGDRASQIESAAAIDAPVAPAQWVTVDGIRALRMERVTPVVPADVHNLDLRKYPWLDRIDMAQVGWSRNGELLCYDAGQFGDFNRDLW